MRGEVIIATFNRANELSRCLQKIEDGKICPERVIIVDASPVSGFHYNGKLNVLYVHTDRTGSSVQRNIGIHLLNAETEIVTFLDDDFYVDESYFENLYKAFKEDGTLIGAEGALRQDGKRIYEPQKENIVLTSLYGCNMSYRVSKLQGIRFDENLKLYAFKEDWDFSYRMSKKGVMKRLHLCTGVHEQSQNKPVNDRKMGYMVIANDCYLKRKNKIFSYKDICYYVAYLAKHLIKGLWSKNSSERFRGGYMVCGML